MTKMRMARRTRGSRTGLDASPRTAVIVRRSMGSTEGGGRASLGLREGRRARIAAGVAV